MSSNLNIFIYDSIYNLNESELNENEIHTQTHRKENDDTDLLNHTNYTKPKDKKSKTTLNFKAERFKRIETYTIPLSSIHIKLTYNHIGTMNIDFNETFSSLTKLIRNQSGKFFENYSFLYYSEMNGTNEGDFKVKILRDIEKTFSGEVFGNDGEVIGEVILLIYKYNR